MTGLVKICGLRTAETLDAALDAQADCVGFVFFPASPRHIDFDTARALSARVRGRAQIVALTVDADDALHEAIIEALRPDMLQLHGCETPERVAGLRKTVGRPVMKALPIETAGDLDAISDYVGVADWVLFDARAPKDATRPGGLGQPFDWTLLQAVDPSLRFMLSGGLHPENVSEALTVTRAPAVDVSSGVESAPGVKDPDKIRAFIKAAREAMQQPSVPRTA